MVMKVSTGQYFDNASSQLATLQNSLSQTQTQLSTSLQIVKPSDAPDKASLVTRLNTEIAKQNSYVASIKTLQNSLTAQDTALKSVDDVMARIKELTVQANSDTMGPSDRMTIAQEMTQLRDQILSIANTQDSNGNYIFAGSRVGQPAFGPDAKGMINYQGDQARLTVAVGDSRVISMNTPGSDAFTRLVRDDGKGGKVGVGFFQAMGDLITSIQTSNKVGMQQGLKEIDTMTLGLSDANAKVGTSLNIADMQSSILGEVNLRLQSTLSDIQDLDYTKAITKMNKDELALQAAQSGFAKISKLSLFNYIN
jgi:flagellar hook-associated protein 3 FlgL